MPLEKPVIRALALIALLLWAPPVAGKGEAACWFEAGTLYAQGLPTTYPFAWTPTPYPVGTTLLTTDGTYSIQTSATSAYFWVRGHGPSLIKAGPQLNDYHVIAICEAA